MGILSFFCAWQMILYNQQIVLFTTVPEDKTIMHFIITKAAVSGYSAQQNGLDK